MSANRTGRGLNSDGLPQQAFTLRDGRGHEFQNDQAHDVPLSALAQTPRNIFSKVQRIYRNDATANAAQAVSDGKIPDDNKAGLIARFLSTLFAIQRKANFTQLSLPVTTATQLILPASSRLYLIIQNLDAAANMFVGFGFRPDGVNGIGLKIIPGGFYEPYQVPQNDIFIAASGNCTATVIFANG